MDDGRVPGDSSVKQTIKLYIICLMQADVHVQS